MRKPIALLAVLLLGVVVSGQGGGPSPEQQAALAKQDALEKATPRLQITEEVLNLSVPGHTIGEAVGVAKNSQGHLFVFTRSGNAGPAKGSTASQLFEFDQNLKFVKQWGPDNYAASFAHTVRVDKQDNVWMTDEGANMIVKFNPMGQVLMVLGRKTEAIDYLERFTERGEKDENRAPVGGVGTFNRPTDVTWDSRRQHLRRRRLQQLPRRQARRRTASGRKRSGSEVPRRTSSIPFTPSPPTRRTTSMSRTAATGAFRCSTRI